MARGRKRTTIKVITHREVELFKALSRVGISNMQQAWEYCSLSQDRIKKLEKSGYIKTSTHVVRGQNNLIIQLDTLGKRYCKEEQGIKSFCVAQTNHLEHDLKLSEAYYTLDSHIKETWRHEGDLIRQIHELHPKVMLKTCIDATVTVAGQIIAIESIGRSYSQEDIELKNEIATSLIGCSEMRCL
jgi:hypothetical protein